MAVMVTLAGKFVNPDESAALIGTRISFQLVPADVPDQVLNETVVPGPVSVPISSGGSFTVTLRATDDPDLLANVDGPLVYRVTRQGLPGNYLIALPMPGPWDWTDLTPQPANDTVIIPGPPGADGAPGAPGDVVALTQAEYDALDPPEDDVLYVITDADEMTVVNLHATGDAEIDGTLDHDGTAVGFYGAAPASKPTSVTARAALETLGLGATLTPDPDFAGSSTTLIGTNTTLAVNPAGLAFAVGRQNLHDFTGTGYTFAYADAGLLFTTDNTAAVTLTVPPTASVPFEVGTHIDIVQLGTGQITIAAAAGVTVHGTPGLKARAQYSQIRVQRVTAANTWIASGDLST